MENNKRIFRCVLIGEKSLLIACAEILLANDYRIELVISNQEEIIKWCEHKEISRASPGVDLYRQVERINFDYLFSIGNFRILSDSVVKSPKLASINFHDGPLPDYAGLNTPVWALLNEATEYGITWHLMASEVDRGDILIQKFFPVESNDTAFSLNTKCFEAGADAFRELIRELRQNSTKPVRQANDISFYESSRRPESACLIDWTQPARKITTLLRALDHGPYFNPMGCAKVYLGAAVISVNSAIINQSYEDGGTELPGTILGAEKNSLIIKCADSALRLNGLKSLAGDQLDIDQVLEQCNLQPGNQFPELPQGARATISEINKFVSTKESFWISRLKQTNPVGFPKAASDFDAESINVLDQPRSVDLGQMVDLTGDPGSLLGTGISIIALLLGRLNNCAESFDIAYSGQRLQEMSDQEAMIFSRWTPMHFEMDYQNSFNILLKSAQSELKLLEDNFCYPRDLFSRCPDLTKVPSCEQYPVAIVTGAPDEAIVLPDECEFSYVFNICSGRVTISCKQDAQHLYAANGLMESMAILVDAIAAAPGNELRHHNIVSEQDIKHLLGDWLPPGSVDNSLPLVHRQFERQVDQSPDNIALICQGKELTYAELNQRSNQLARRFLEEGVATGDRIAVLADQSPEMLVFVFAVLKSGCAYVPLDPTYPGERLSYMVDDSDASLIITQQKYSRLMPQCKCRQLLIEDAEARLQQPESSNLDLAQDEGSLAYLIYTSGSTGKPKGVMLEHRNVANFFHGMDSVIDRQSGTWLAVTSISFDISVLELLWTLARGFRVILHADDTKQKVSRPVFKRQLSGMDFSLFYWNVASDESEYDIEKYRLLLESARYGDQNDFSAVWTPERHFGAFGGLYPNPSVTSAALATITNRIKIRGGSCVVPLHSPIRVAEEWSVVDNLSNGRVGISIAAGWAAPDFAIKPENFANAKQVMFENTEIIRRLWRGETVEMPGPDKQIPVRILPRPIQSELPVWVTTAGNIETFLQAAEIGGNILTHLLGQSLEEVAEKISAYRKAWKKHGHPGNGYVSLLLHTFVGSEAREVKDQVREPMKNYLKNAMFLVKSAAWQFPAFKKFSAEQSKTLDEFFETISDEDMDALLEFAFQRYYGTSGLFGTPETCMEMVDKIKDAGIDEIGCLIDFGMETDVVLQNLPNLNALRIASNARDGSEQDDNADSIPALIKKYEVSHLQCTPSMATILLEEPEGKKALASLEHLMIGGEAFPPQLANQLLQLKAGRLSNMYGPTETTIWSSTEEVTQPCQKNVSIGRPIANTQIYVLDRYQNILPIGIPGEIVIGGKGVARGYYNRDSLTSEKFLSLPSASKLATRVYQTGDLGRYRPDGKLEYLGRIDQQVKMRGYRIELGEIEAILGEHESVMECAVILREDKPGDQRLTSYLRPALGHTIVPTSLRRHVQKRLPDFMVPSYFISLSQLPRTLNGKIDRNSLARLSTDTAVEYHIVLPETKAEKYLVSVWQKSLESGQISTTDNFFEAGGHSLLAAQVVAQIRRETGITIPLATMVVNTLRQTAAQMFPSDWCPSTKMSA